MTNVALIPLKDANPLLAKILAPLSKHFAPLDTVEIRMGHPGRVVIDRRGSGKEIVNDPELSIGVIEHICQALANKHGLKFDADTHPKLSCVLPGGHRFECLLGASVQSGLSLAIRCKHPFTPTWEQMGVTQAVKSYLLEAIEQEKNIIISGSTNTGKTTLLNMLLEAVPDYRRVVALEDTPELHIERFWDGIGLLAERETTNESGMLNWRQLYDHLMRITPDHPVLQEISTLNVFAALAVLNAGMTGFMCTIHAGSPYQAIHRKFDQNIEWAGEKMSDISKYLTELIDVVVQIKRDKDGWRRITDIYEPINDRYILKDGKEVTP